MKTQKIVIPASTRPWEPEQGWKEELCPRPASQPLCWTPSEAWPAEVKRIRTHYHSLPGQFRPQAGDSWQSAQGTGKDMPPRGRNPGGWKRTRSPGVTKELKLRLLSNGDTATASKTGSGTSEPKDKRPAFTVWEMPIPCWIIFWIHGV